MTRKRWIFLGLAILVALSGCNDPSINSGDRVLVAKCLYETGLKKPERFDVVVFKYPNAPMKNHVPTNYIKRLLGLPGELLAIFFGQIFRMLPEAPPPGVPEDVDPLRMWQRSNQPHGKEFDDLVRDGFAARKFEILRKPPEVMMAMRRIVFDNNHQPSDLKNFPPRWNPASPSGWKISGDRRSFEFAGKNAAEPDWLTYQHLIRPEGPVGGIAAPKAQLITDFMGYNAFNLHEKFKADSFPINWVGDLMVECNVEVTTAGGQFYLELNKGHQRFQAKWDLTSGDCTVYRIGAKGAAEQLGSAATALRGTGSHLVRFANFDSRLTVWVDRELVFGDGVPHDPIELPAAGEKVTFEDIQNRCGPQENDLKRPASLGATGINLKVTDLRLWRDTYYTMNVSHADVYAPPLSPEVLASPAAWEPFRRLEPTGFYVYPNHYLCLGDNSTHSSDSRDWGLVPERLMLGRALMVYFPLHRAGLIR
jgi:signal peptidase I